MPVGRPPGRGLPGDPAARARYSRHPMAPNDFPAGGYVSDYVAFWVIWLAIVGGTVVFFRATRGRGGRARLVAGNVCVLASILWTAVVLAETYLRYV
jgi:hypothetical protein